MRNFRQTIKMMAVALVLAAAFCSCSSVGLDDAAEAPVKSEAPKAESQSTAQTARTLQGLCPKAVLSGTTLTFYYDDKDHETEGKVYEVCSRGYGVKGAPWASAGFTAARFDESCQGWKPASLIFFFSGCTKVETIDCANLDTSAVVDMSCMFQKCRSLQSLDLTGFSTASVIEMYRMFNECGVLQSITVDSSFIQKATELGSYEMYRLCPAQVVID